jgi:hypothetical protein
MKSREDMMIERILNKRCNRKNLPVLHATTLVMVKAEARRRVKADGDARVVYMNRNGELGIRVANEKKSGDQTSLCLVSHNGRIRDLI